MKKVALSLAGVLAAAAFAPEASAVPSFARQTGMACSACHYMKFPVLNSFGRAFKAAGYTQMGSQEKVEGEHLSIPAVLNASLLFKYRYVQDSGNGVKEPTGYNPTLNKFTTAATMPAGYTAGTAGKTIPTDTVNGQWQMADEFSLFFGGRVAETDHFKIGFMMENNVANPGGALVAGFKMPVVVPLGDINVSVIPFTTDALGVQYGFELSSGGVLRANRWAELRREVSAIQYNADRGADGGAAAGTAFVLQHELGFVNFTKWSSSFAPGGNGQGIPSTNFGQNYIRAALTPSVAGFDLILGGGAMSGTSYGNLAGGTIESTQTFADFQAHGEIAGMESGIYAQYASAPACGADAMPKVDAADAHVTTTTTAIGSTNVVTGVTFVDAVAGNAKGCAYNTGSETRTAMTIGGEVAVIPHALTVGAAYRSVSNDGSGKTDNAITLTAVYDLVQNVALHLNYAMYSGTKYDAAGTATSRLLGMLEAAW